MNSIFDRFKSGYLYPGPLTGDIHDVQVTTNITTAYVNCKNFPITCFFLQRGFTTDAIDVFKVVQATDSSGTGVKDVTGLALTAFTGIDTVGDVACLELDAEALDVANSFTHAAVVFSLGADTGVNNICVWYVQGQARYAHRALNARVAADAAASMIKLMS